MTAGGRGEVALARDAGADPGPRRDRVRRVVATAVAAVCALGFLIAGAVVVLALGDSRYQDEAEVLVRSGVPATVESVDTRWDVTVGFRVGEQVQRAELVATDSTVVEEGMTVLYLPADPEPVMTADDARYYAEDALAGAGRFAMLCLMPSALTVLAWLLCGRPPWWRHVDERRVPGPGMPDVCTL